MGTNEPLQPNGERYDFVSLCLAEDRHLERVLRCGVRPDPAQVAGWEWKGYATTQLSLLLGRAKFKKGFLAEGSRGAPPNGLTGYNVSCYPNTLGEPWIEKTRAGAPMRHGWFDAYPVTLSERDDRYPNALLLNYGTTPDNLTFDPERALRAYVTQVYPDTANLLLGKAYVALGPTRLPLTYFALERHNEASK